MKCSIILLFALFFMSNCTRSPSNFSSMIGAWEFVSSDGGKMGNGYILDHDQLVIDADHNFELLEENNVIASGNINDQSSEQDVLFVFFEGTTEDATIPHPLVNDGEKFVTFANNDMQLISPCCDRYNSFYKKL